MNILHISDAHFTGESKNEVSKIIELLIKDVKKVQSENDFAIDFVCFSGDLIQRGDKAKGEDNLWDNAIDVIVSPILKALKLGKDKYIFVQGNHEIDITKIDEIIDKGMQADNQENIDRIYMNLKDAYVKQDEYFYDIVREWHSDARIEKRGYSVVRNVENKKIGFACVDSAWRSKGAGNSERGHLYVASKQIEELYDNLSDADFKICLMHHPVDWLNPCEQHEVEKALSKFDFVLRGHVHEEDDKQLVRREVSTIISTAGKLYPLEYAEGVRVDGYNGYTIISANMIDNTCKLYLRTYFAKNRNEFGPAENVCDKGIASYEISVKDKIRLNALRINQGVRQFYGNASEKYANFRAIDRLSPEDMRKVLIEPVLDEKSVVRSNEKNERITVTQIVDSEDNVMLVGQKECGKTTVLQQIALSYSDEYEKYSTIPIYINMRKLQHGKDRIFWTAVNFVQNTLQDKYSISKEEIKAVLEREDIVYLLDNVCVRDADHIAWIQAFDKNTDKKRVIISIDDEFLTGLDAKEYPPYFDSFRKVYIRHLGKAQIREFVNNWAPANLGKSNDYLVEKIDLYCNRINFAKTPFNISVLMVLIDSDKNFVPINEGIVMENYLEIVLEKFAYKESDRSNYSFSIKKDFLSYLAHEMYLKGEYHFSYNEFLEKTLNYHNEKAFDLMDSKFDKLFFEKNILICSEGDVSFSHTSFFEFFLAYYALDDQSFLNEITQKGKRIFFHNEICFYAGLNQKCAGLLDSLSNTIVEEVINHLDAIEKLNDIEILAEFRQNKEEMIESIKRSRFTQKELDEMSDRRNNARLQNAQSTKLDKCGNMQSGGEAQDNISANESSGIEEVTEQSAEDFYSLLQMYGSVIKNAELLNEREKIMHLEYYMYGMNLLYALVVILFEQLKQDSRYENLNEKSKEILDVSTEEEYENTKSEWYEMTKLVFPLAIQYLAYENVGTPKLDKTVKDLMEAKKDKAFERFMLFFLRCDLRQTVKQEEVSEYIKEEMSPTILKLISAKLETYYKMRFGGSGVDYGNKILDLIVEVQNKLYPTMGGSNGPSKNYMKKTIRNQLDRLQ